MAQSGTNRRFMKRTSLLVSLLALVTVSQAVPQNGTASSQAGSTAIASSEPWRAMIDSYCAGCHSSQARAGGLALDVMDMDAVAGDAELWEKAVRKLRGRLMPPPGARQPEQREVDALVGWLEARLDSNPDIPRAGHVPIQRLNRTEYAAAVKMLVGVEVDVEEVLPQDVAIEGFDNIAAALSVSPAFVDQYVSAARSIAREAVGGPLLESVKYTLNENRGGEAMPLGLRDGLKFEHYFPADGEYRVSVLFPD
jgi:mono/diheme cytochrome c family protein